jgi:hypothetical protein
MLEIIWGMLIVVSSEVTDTGYRFDSYLKCAEFKANAQLEIRSQGEFAYEEDRAFSQQLICSPMQNKGWF